MKYKITFIGSGNIATNLAIACDQAGHKINQVISRDVANAKVLASKFGAYYGDEPSTMYKDSDIVILCVSDEAYYGVLEELPGGMNAVICHTAGPVAMSILQEYASQYGVFYPLQSLRKEQPTDLLSVPMMLEWSDAKAKHILTELANSISNVVREVSSVDRARYHLSAVFANNFTNAMYTVAEDYLGEHNLEMKYLLPIIQETAIRLKKGVPSQWQTGPAKRGDESIMEKHKEMLDAPQLVAMYSAISDFLKIRYGDTT